MISCRRNQKKGTRKTSDKQSGASDVIPVACDSAMRMFRNLGISGTGLIDNSVSKPWPRTWKQSIEIRAGIFPNFLVEVYVLRLPSEIGQVTESCMETRRNSGESWSVCCSRRDETLFRSSSTLQPRV